MFLQGVLSLIQITFLPGFLFLRLFKLKLDFLITIIFAFALSLIANYISIFGLTSLGFYSRTSVYVVFCIELIILFGVCFSEIKKYLNINIFPFLLENFKKQYRDLIIILNSKYSKYSNLFWISIVGSIGSIIWALYFLFNNVFYLTIFIRHDPVVSWNRWALDWFAGNLPGTTWHYPQLIPANWSLSYQFLGEQLQYFPKIIMPLFTIFTLILIFYLGVYKKTLGYFIAVITTTLFIRHAFGGMVESGLVDLPVAFMSFVAIYCLLRAQDFKDISTVKKYLVLGIIFACGGAVTKQAGLLILILYPLLTYLLVVRKKFNFSYRDIWLFFIFYFTSIVIIVASFYVYKELQILSGLDGSEIKAVTCNIYQGSGLFQRFVFSVKIFLSYNLFFLNIIENYYLHFIVGTVLGLFYALLLLFSLKNVSYRILFFLVLVPYSFLWSLFFCYDLRNYSLVLPYYGLGLGLGFENFLLVFDGIMLKKIKSFFSDMKLYVLLLMIVLLLILIHLKYSKTYLLDKQIDLNMQLYRPKVNKKLAEYDSLVGIKKAILTDYEIRNLFRLKKIPMIYQYFYTFSNCGYAGKKNEDNIIYEQYCNQLKKTEIGYLLLPPATVKSVLDDVDKKIAAGDYKLIFKKEGYQFVKVS